MHIILQNKVLLYDSTVKILYYLPRLLFLLFLANTGITYWTVSSCTSRILFEVTNYIGPKKLWLKMFCIGDSACENKLIPATKKQTKNKSIIVNVINPLCNKSDITQQLHQSLLPETQHRYRYESNNLCEAKLSETFPTIIRSCFIKPSPLCKQLRVSYKGDLCLDILVGNWYYR